MEFRKICGRPESAGIPVRFTDEPAKITGRDPADSERPQIYPVVSAVFLSLRENTLRLPAQGL